MMMVHDESVAVAELVLGAIGNVFNPNWVMASDILVTFVKIGAL